MIMMMMLIIILCYLIIIVNSYSINNCSRLCNISKNSGSKNSVKNSGSKDAIRSLSLLYYQKRNNDNDNDAIDPMDVIVNNNNDNNDNNNNKKMKKRIQQQQRIDMKPIIYDEKELETMLLQEEANILKSLPTNLLIVFNNLMEQIVWRFAFVSVTTHVMLLIPVLRYVKLTLGMSIIPYIYIFPMLFIFPFIIYGLWDTNTTKISYIDELLLSFLTNQQNLAKLNLEEQNNKFQNLILLNDITPESVKYLAYVRLFTRISPDVLRDEILALKQKASGKKLTILNTSTESNIDIESFPMNNNNNNNMNVVNAAQTVIKVVSATGQDQKETLNELKELQQMLSNINKKQDEK